LGLTAYQRISNDLPTFSTINPRLRYRFRKNPRQSVKISGGTLIYKCMQKTKYIGVSQDFVEETFHEFRKYISSYQWSFDHPSHSPRAVEITSAIKNRGKKGACTFNREGYKYVLPILRTWCFKKAIQERRKIYYVSYGKYALLYCDIDLHYAWQTEEEGERAKNLINALMNRFFGQSVLFWCDSNQGFNGYLKIDLQEIKYAQANALFERLEKAIQRFLAHYENLADFELKGRIGYLDDDKYNWKQYGKLPIHQQDWNGRRLTEFKNTPMVSIRKLESLCPMIETHIPAEMLDKMKERKKSLGDAPIINGRSFLVTPSIEKALLEKHGERGNSCFPFTRKTWKAESGWACSIIGQERYRLPNWN
jgi:hypothetical protein